jgi:hypothetical protein
MATRTTHPMLLSRRMRNGDRKCPSCSVAVETRDHIIRCPQAERRRWRISFMAKIDEFHERENTSPLLRQLWREAMELWFAEEVGNIHLSPILFPVEVRHVITQQNAIGWRQVFTGRFANGWVSVHEDFLERQVSRSSSENTTARKKRKGKQWQTHFLQEIWKQWSILWKGRNELVHGTTQSTRQAALRRTAEVELRTIYDTREQLEREAQKLLT